MLISKKRFESLLCADVLCAGNGGSSARPVVQRRVKIFMLVAMALGLVLSPAVGQSVPPGEAVYPGWRAPVEISSGAEWCYPHVAVDGGYIHVVWRDWTACKLQYRRSTDGGQTWDPTIHSLYGWGCNGFPQIAAKGQYVHIVWKSDTGISYRRSTDFGVTFESKVDLGTGGFGPDVATVDGYVYLIWVDNFANPGYLYFKRNTSNGAPGSWDASPTIVATNALEHARIAASGKRVYVVWDSRDYDPGFCTALFRRSNIDNGATWETTITVLWSDPESSYSQYSLSIAALDSKVLVDRIADAPSGPFQKRNSNWGAATAWSANAVLGNGGRLPEVAASGSFDDYGCNTSLRGNGLYVSLKPNTETLVCSNVSTGSCSADIGADVGTWLHLVYNATDDKIYYRRNFVMPTAQIKDISNGPPHAEIIHFYDDGSSEISMGLTPGGDLCWIHRFDALPGGEYVETVETIFGSAAMPGYGPPDGTPCDAFVWIDPNSDGNPEDCVLLASEASQVENIDTDTMNGISLSDVVFVVGDFYVGCCVTLESGQYIAPVDMDTAYNTGDAWIGYSLIQGGFDPYNLANNDELSEMASLGFPYYFCLGSRCYSLNPIPR